jgi:hypothetical protein
LKNLYSNQQTRDFPIFSPFVRNRCSHKYLTWLGGRNFPQIRYRISIVLPSASLGATLAFDRPATNAIKRKKERVADLVRSRFREQSPITYSEFLHLLQYQHGILICADILRHMIRNIASVKTIIGCTMETERVSVNPDEISVWFKRVSSIVDGIPREFVFNTDETGCLDHTDSREV